MVNKDKNDPHRQQQVRRTETREPQRPARVLDESGPTPGTSFLHSGSNLC